jgi:hypothetical protein
MLRLQVWDVSADFIPLLVGQIVRVHAQGVDNEVLQVLMQELFLIL